MLKPLLGRVVAQVAWLFRYIKEGNEYIYCRPDGVMIDGRLHDGRSSQVDPTLCESALM